MSFARLPAPLRTIGVRCPRILSRSAAEVFAREWGQRVNLLWGPGQYDVTAVSGTEDDGSVGGWGADDTALHWRYRRSEIRPAQLSAVRRITVAHDHSSVADSERAGGLVNPPTPISAPGAHHILSSTILGG